MLHKSTTDRDFWWEWRVRCYHDCLRGVARITACDDSGSETQSHSAVKPGRAKTMTLLWLSLKGTTQIGQKPVETLLSDPEPKKFLSILKYVQTVCGDGNEEEAFFISRVLCQKLTVPDDVMTEYVSLYLKLLCQQKDLYK